MKKLTQKGLLLGTFALGFCGFMSQAQARVGFEIQVNEPLPHEYGEVDEAWESPGYGAVWVKPHYEWVDGRWAWVRGYYEYPPRRGAVYVAGRYEHRHGHHYWRRPHWK